MTRFGHLIGCAVMAVGIAVSLLYIVTTVNAILRDLP